MRVLQACVWLLVVGDGIAQKGKGRLGDKKSRHLKSKSGGGKGGKKGSPTVAVADDLPVFADGNCVGFEVDDSRYESVAEDLGVVLNPPQGREYILESSYPILGGASGEECFGEIFRYYETIEGKRIEGATVLVETKNCEDGLTADNVERIRGRTVAAIDTNLVELKPLFKEKEAQKALEKFAATDDDTELECVVYPTIEGDKLAYIGVFSSALLYIVIDANTLELILECDISEDPTSTSNGSRELHERRTQQCTALPSILFDDTFRNQVSCDIRTLFLDNTGLSTLCDENEGGQERWLSGFADFPLWDGILDCRNNVPQGNEQRQKGSTVIGNNNYLQNRCFPIEAPNCEDASYDVHFGVLATLDLLKNELGLTQGFAPAGVNAPVIKGYIRFTGAGNFCNAFANGSAGLLVFGSCTSCEYVALDIIAHETMHIVTRNTSNLARTAVGRAMNEALSDIAGALVEYSVNNKRNPGDLMHTIDCTRFRPLLDSNANICTFSCGGSPYVNMRILTTAYANAVAECTAQCDKAKAIVNSKDKVAQCAKAMGVYFLYVNIYGMQNKDKFTEFATETCSQEASFRRAHGGYAGAVADTCTREQLLHSVEVGWNSVNIRFNGDMLQGQCTAVASCNTLPTCPVRRSRNLFEGESCALPRLSFRQLMPRELQTCRPRQPSTPTGRGRTSGVFGDPHLSTFDRLRFDCQAHGEFIVVKSLDPSSDFMIQERFSAVGSNICSQVSVSTGVAIRETGLPTIQVSVVQGSDKTGATNLFGNCYVALYVGRMLTDLVDDLGTDEIEIAVVGSQIIIFYPYTGVRIRLDARSSTTFGCFFLVRVFLPFEYDNKVIGLYGKPNGSRGDDWVQPDGSPYQFGLPTTPEESLFTMSYNYCTSNWCIRDPLGSLFTYGPEESFEDISGCDETYTDQINDLVQQELMAENSSVVDVCGRDNLVCLIDGICGSVSDAVATRDDAAALLSDQDDSAPLPTPAPSALPSVSASPSRDPSDEPSRKPSETPSRAPSRTPSAAPSANPSKSSFPSVAPSGSFKPSNAPSRTKSGKGMNTFGKQGK